MSTVSQIFCTCTTSESSNKLAGKVVVVTGASSGIGKSIAEKIVAEGGKVIAIARRKDKLEELSVALGDNCKSFVFDVTRYKGEEKLFDDMERIFDMPISALVNNAGVYVDRKLGEYTLEDFERIINTNLKAPFFLTQAFIVYCRKKSLAGNVVMTASNRALFGDVGPYGISKAGLLNAVCGFARETVLDGIRINAVAPGMTASEINHININGNLYTDSARGKRVLLPSEIAEIVCFLLSDLSKCITGAVIPCDEGDYLR